jgi:hypothetical protein
MSLESLEIEREEFIIAGEIALSEIEKEYPEPVEDEREAIIF